MNNTNGLSKLTAWCKGNFLFSSLKIQVHFPFFHRNFCRMKYTKISKEKSFCPNYYNLHFQLILFSQAIPILAKKCLLFQNQSIELHWMISLLVLHCQYTVSISIRYSCLFTFFIFIFLISFFYQCVLWKIHTPWVMFAKKYFYGLFGSSVFLSTYVQNHHNIWLLLEYALFVQ